jgi:hypothetical protein
MTRVCRIGEEATQSQDKNNYTSKDKHFLTIVALFWSSTFSFRTSTYVGEIRILP